MMLTSARCCASVFAACCSLLLLLPLLLPAAHGFSDQAVCGWNNHDTAFVVRLAGPFSNRCALSQLLESWAAQVCGVAQFIVLYDKTFTLHKGTDVELATYLQALAKLESTALNLRVFAIDTEELAKKEFPGVEWPKEVLSWGNGRVLTHDKSVSV